MGSLRKSPNRTQAPGLPHGDVPSQGTDMKKDWPHFLTYYVLTMARLLWPLHICIEGKSFV